MGYPGKYSRPRAFFEAAAKDDGPATATCWRIARADKPQVVVYEMWTFLVDSGTVFRAGKSTPTGAGMIQGSLEVTKPTPALRALAEDLARAAPF